MARQGKGKPIKFTVTDTNTEHTLSSFRKEHANHLTLSQLRHKYYTLSCPDKVSIADMTLVAAHGGQNTKTVIVGEKDNSRSMTITEISRACNESTGMIRPVGFYYRRWVNEGKKTHHKNLDVFCLTADEYKAHRLRLKGHRSNIDLSQVPQGDLAHLIGRSKKRRAPLVQEDSYKPSLMEKALLAIM